MQGDDILKACKRNARCRVLALEWAETGSHGRPVGSLWQFSRVCSADPQLWAHNMVPGEVSCRRSFFTEV